MRLQYFCTSHDIVGRKSEARVDDARAGNKRREHNAGDVEIVDRAEAQLTDEVGVGAELVPGRD